MRTALWCPRHNRAQTVEGTVPSISYDRDEDSKGTVITLTHYYCRECELEACLLALAYVYAGEPARDT